MRVVWAIAARDFRIAWSYRFSFIFQNASILFSLLSLKFVANLFRAGSPEALDRYGGDYFAFALLGLGLSLVSFPAVRVFAGAVRTLQVTGTFEAMLTTRANPVVIILSSGIYAIVTACFQLALVIAVGSVALGAGFRAANLGLALAVLAMVVVALCGIGLMSAAFAVAFKQNEPFSGAFITASLMVSGILYPTDVLPSWLERLAPLLPMTHAIELTRGLLLDDARTGSLGAHFAALAAFCLLLPIGVVTLTRAITWAKRTGSLAHY